MAVPVIWIDGAQPYGTPTCTINATVVILDSISISRGMDVAEDRTRTGAPNRQRGTTGFDTMTATAQAPSGTNIPMKFGDTFSMLFDDNYGTELWVCGPVNIEASNDPTQIRKLPITARKVYNGSVTTSNT